MKTTGIKSHYTSLSPSRGFYCNSSLINLPSFLQVHAGQNSNKSNSVARADVPSPNKSIDHKVIPLQKLAQAPLKERKEKPELQESKSVRMSKPPTDSPQTLKTQPMTSLKAVIDLKGSSILTKTENEKFSPYILFNKKDEKKPEPPSLKRVLIELNSLEKSTALPKPQRGLTSEPLALKTPSANKEAHYFSFVVGKGNNDAVIRRVMQKRYWWKETYTANNVCDFCWYQTNKPINFTSLNSSKSGKKIANHFEFNKEIGTKSLLLLNLHSYCEKNGLDLFQITPVTFLLDLYDSHFTADFQAFNKIFKEFDKMKEPENPKPINDAKTPQKSKTKETTIVVSQRQVQTKLASTYYDGCNLWLLKPTDYNRGRGINLFNKLSTLDQYLKSFQKVETQVKTGSSAPCRTSSNIVKSHRFVVQKYIEKPFLVDGRKFDMRVWALVDHEMNLYWFKEGYLRLSSEGFNLSDERIEDIYVHLTNNAVQKYSKNYGKHESGNIISLNEIQKYLPKDNPKVTLDGIKNRIKELIKISMESVKNKLNACDRKFCFEIFGYDFLLDAEYNVWLIEVNSNPSIDESNGLLRMLVPRMIDDAFRLTLDRIFSAKTGTRYEEMFREDVEKDFPVRGYSNFENMWYI